MPRPNLTGESVCKHCGLPVVWAKYLSPGGRWRRIPLNPEASNGYEELTDGVYELLARRVHTAHATTCKGGGR